MPGRNFGALREGVLPLSDHAKFEMKRREISDDQVESVFKKPEQKISLENEREIWQNKIRINGKEYIIRLVMQLLPRPKIVTIYKSSKIKKYWREK